MANSYPSLLDVAKRRGNDALEGLIDEASKSVPEMRVISTKTIKGRDYKTLVCVQLPTAAFRNANEGSDATKGVWAERQFQTYISTPRWACDKAIADNNPDESAEEMMADQAWAHTQAELQLCASQMYYGVANDAKGFPGLISAYDSVNMVVDAGGTTASTGSSVWLLCTGPKKIEFIAGNNGNMILSDVEIGWEEDANGKKFKAYQQDLTNYIGLKVTTQKALVRIKKLTEDPGKGLTDALIYSALSKFSPGWMPDKMFMTMRSLEQLRKSRTATTVTGAPAPTPTEVANVPIFVTEAITNTEALTL